MAVDFTETESELASLRRQLAEARENMRLIQERKSQYVMGTDIPLQLAKEERQLLERIEELEQRIERSEGPSEQAARLGPLYEQLQAAAARQEWAEVLALGGRIQALDPDYRDVAEWMARARDHLRRPPRRAPRVRPAWLWPVVGGVAALLVVIGVAVAVVLRLVGTLLPPTFVPQLTDTQVPSTTAPQPTETPTSMPALPTATPWPTETLLPPTATLRATETPTPGDYTGARPPAEADIGDTWTRPADGMVMVYVPAGEFLMGSSDTDGQARNDEKPQHTVYLDAYWIDRTEVTNAQYRKCVEAGACREPGCWDDENYNAPGQPVVCATWDDAQSYATWVGGRLPTEAEWEKAARGTDGRIYPWGDEFDGTRLNYCDRSCEEDYKDTGADDGYALTAPVGRYPSGASPYGALDMAGNVWEWTRSLWGKNSLGEPDFRYPYNPGDGRENLEAGLDVPRVERGGGFSDPVWYVRCAVRVGISPGNWYGLTGFRVVASPVHL